MAEGVRHRSSLFHSTKSYAVRLACLIAQRVRIAWLTARQWRTMQTTVNCSEVNLEATPANIQSFSICGTTNEAFNWEHSEI